MEITFKIAMTIKSFEPVADLNCKILILGTMPGNESLLQNQYYGHPDNVFWDIILRVLIPSITDEEIDIFTYNEKRDLLLSNNIALWDVLKHCDREGNLDNKIRNEIKNDFQAFFHEHSKIDRVLFNGQKAEKYFYSCFKQLIEDKNIKMTTLPSTSPSHKLNAFRKLRLWRLAIKE